METPLHARAVAADIAHLVQVFTLQGKLYSNRASGASQWDIFGLPWPSHGEAQHPYAQLVAEARETHDRLDDFAIRLVIALALAPFVQPQALDPLAAGDERGRPFTEYGGLSNPTAAGFLPSLQTALFLLSGNDLGLRFRFQALFEPDAFLRREGILEMPLDQVDPEPSRTRLLPTQGFLHLAINGTPYAPAFSSRFPAKRLRSALSWQDLVIADTTKAQIDTVRHWLQHHQALAEDPVMGRRLMPGFRALFHGPSGTGKTLTATLLGQEVGIPVYRVDLSQVVSKYIGETEKNLQRLFQEAAGKGWILFFDEADALFGKRSQTQSAHDRYANQEVSFLLQQVEDHEGLVILASNFRANIDTAFLRRFQAVVQFNAPRYAERKLLWEQSLPAHFPLADDVDLDLVARKYEVTGAHVVNILQAAVLEMLGQGERSLRSATLLRAIHQEFYKEERHVE